MPMLVREMRPPVYPVPFMVGHTNLQSSTTTITLPMVSGVTLGDTMFLLVSTFVATSSPPAGWTLQFSQMRSATSNGYIFTKQYAGESTVTVTMSAAGSFHQATLEVWRGCDPVEPVGNSNGRQANTNITSVTFTGALETTRKNSVVLYTTGIATASAFTGLTWSGATERTDFYYLSGSNRYVMGSASAAYAEITAATAVNVIATRSGSGSGINWFLIALVIQPPG